MPAWVDELQRDLAGTNAASELARWKKHSVHRVPAAVKDLHPHAYRPKVVSLGPFHHGDERLRHMEQHKRRAVRQLLRRSGRKLEEFVAAVQAAAQELEDAYQDIGDEWRGKHRERFLQVMVTDGCFLLEVMRTASERENDYADDDPVFSSHGLLYPVANIRHDMIILENQLPLLVLEKLLAVESYKESIHMDDVEYKVKMMVRRFISPSCKTPRPAKEHKALHPLDVLHKSMLSGPYQKQSGGAGRDDGHDEEAASGIIRPAAELYEAGIRFKRSKTASLHDITFRRGVLSLPFLVVDDSTEYMFLNLMAFERLHAGAGNEVTAYVFFMDSIIDTARDVALLTSKGIIRSVVGSDKAVAKLFNGLCKDVPLDDGGLDAVHLMVNRYCRKPWRVWRANLVSTYFRSPWSFVFLAAAVFLLIAMTIVQTVYTVLPFYQG